jgi:hypothetical protein
MPINFPNSPSPNQQYTYDNKTWGWNGIYWEVYSALTSYVTSTTFNSYTGVTQPLIYSSITGGTYSGGTLYLVNNSGGTITITGFSTSSSGGTISGDYLPLSGGTVNGATEFTGGLTANTISATTYLGNVITSVSSVGSGTPIYDSTSSTTANIRSITSDITNKVAVSLNNETINLGVNEQNLTLWNLVVQGNKLLNGSVSYVSGLTFSVSPLEYLINGQIYTISAETTVTLTSGDSTFDRIDVIYADISGNTGVLQGVPSANPEKVLVDGDTEVEVTFVLVRANSTSADVSTFVIYNENSGPPSEWTFGSGGVQPTRIIGNFTGVTYSGGTSIRVSGVTGAYTTFFRLTGSTILNTNNYSTLQFAIRNLSANTTTSAIRFRFLTTGGTQNGSVVTMNGAGTANVVQYSPTNVSTWQLISIPLWRFYLTNTNVQVLEVSFSPQGTGAQSRYYFDLLEFVEGTSSAPPSNSWTTIQGDSASTTITAPNPNATLILSGGTNISSSISGTSTVVFNLDNNINLNGVTATTISATTYQNLPIDIRVTGGTYSNGNTTFRNNTGGTFTVTGSTIYSSGILSGSSNWVSNGNGSVNLPTVQVALYNNSSYTEPVQVYTVSSGVTGSGGIAALTDNDTNYIYIEYNNGSPRWGVSTDNSFINGSDIDLCYLIYRANNFVHVLDFGNEGAGLPNKISNRIVAVNRFGRESGFSLGLSGATGVVTLTSGVAWNGTNRQSLVPVNSQDDIFFKNFHSGGTWVYTTTGDTINNTYYDDGTDIVLATASKYLVNWYFRGQEINDHLYEVYGTDEYDSVAEAQLSVEPVLPELITSHAFLTGRIIVQVSATTGSVESAFVQVFQSTQVTQHNDLTSIQGGAAGEYYHLTASEYSNNAYTNVDNNFSVGQTISGGLIVDTISATTISGDTLYGDGSNLINVPNIYNIDGSLTGERIVTLDGNNIRFKDGSNNFIIDSKLGFVVNNDDEESTGFSVKPGNGSMSIGGPLSVNSGDITLNNLTSDNSVPYLLGLDVSNSARTFDANYIYNSITGGSFSDNTLYLTNNTGGTVTISGFGSATFTGGTVTGPTNFTSGLTSNTISATTYQNLPATLPLTGGTISGNVIVNGLTALTQNVIISPNLSTYYQDFFSATSMDIQGSYLYIQDSGNLKIVDVSIPSSPKTVSSFSFGFVSLQKLVVNGRYVYIAGGNPASLKIIDVINPSSPTLISTTNSISTVCNNIKVQGGYAYLVNETSQSLEIFDISNPSSPTMVSNTTIVSSPKNIFIQGNYAYIVGNTSGVLQIVNVSNPSSPNIVGSGSTSGTTPTSVYVVGRFAYVTNSASNNLRIIDISNPSSLTNVGSTTVTSATTVYVQGNYAYVTEQLGELVSSVVGVVDISNPSSPQLVQTLNSTSPPTDLIVQGKYLYVISAGGLDPGLSIYNLGSSYIQQLEAGGIETTTLTTLSDATVGNDLTVVGGLNVNQSLNVQGGISTRTVRILPVALTVVSSTASTDASLSSTFTLTLTGNTTLATPTNGFSGQRIIYRLTQDGTGNKLLTLSSGFRSGPITVTLSTAANTTDYLGVIYNEIDNEWDVLGLNKGYS